MDLSQLILGPILNPRADGSVDFHRDGAIHCDASGKIDFVGRASDAPPTLAPSRKVKSRGLIMPPMLDAHIHIPQHPIRGRFMDGVGQDTPNGRLIAGLNRNVFPAESRCADDAVANTVIDQFLADTLSKGVVGGAAYMTVHATATRAALARLPKSWSVGLVMMNMNCPDYLRTNEATLEGDIRSLAGDFGRRFIVTDRFAVAVNTPLRRRAVALAEELGLRMQTHLNEQIGEKNFVEKQLYPSYASYTDVYLRDGLLDREPILAHCIRMSGEEFDIVAETRGVIAHCPTSNTLLGSGVMPLDEVVRRGINWAICTDVGASPTTSLLAEMAQFLKVHAGRSKHAMPQQALYRTTVAPARLLMLQEQLGSFEIGKPLSFIEIATAGESFTDADDAILRGLLGLTQRDLAQYENGPCADAVGYLQAAGLEAGKELALLESDCRETARRLEDKVISVTLTGREVWRRADARPV